MEAVDACQCRREAFLGRAEKPPMEERWLRRAGLARLPCEFRSIEKISLGRQCPRRPGLRCPLRLAGGHQLPDDAAGARLFRPVPESSGKFRSRGSLYAL